MKQFGCPIVEKVLENISVVELYSIAYQRLKLYLKKQNPSYLESYYQDMKKKYQNNSTSESFSFSYKNEHVQNALYMPASNDDAVAGVSHPHYGFVLRIVNQVN